MNYNFQIQEDNKSWEDTLVRQVSFKKRKEAVSFARLLSEMFNTEVRLTDGDHLITNGAYINA